MNQPTKKKMVYWMALPTVVLIGTVMAAEQPLGRESRTDKQVDIDLYTVARAGDAMPKAPMAHEFISSFGRNSKPVETVEEYLDAVEDFGILLHQTLDDGTVIAVAWSPNGLDLSMIDGGGHLIATQVDRSDPYRIEWTSTASDSPEFRASISSSQGRLVVDVNTAHSGYRLLHGGTEGGSLAKGIVVTLSLVARCACRAVPPKGTCANPDCDKSEGCTGGKGTCVWYPYSN